MRAAEPLRFNRDVRPILANHCFGCHGQDKNARKAGLRLDVREHALVAAESGAMPIVPGKPDASEVVRRIFNSDAAEMMPPPSANKELTKTERELLRRWIAEGAKYEPHWAFIAPVRPQPPAVKQADWRHNALDNFVLARLEREGLQPSPQAEWTTLFRRVSLDLTGLPPAPADVAAFVSEINAAQSNPGSSRERNRAADAVYNAWVNKMLASPRYGERMAVDWLDCARFADTNGYQVDRDREMSIWRDWVIAAFNSNESFDQFTVDQLAGDLLPESTFQQKIATGFQRNHMFNEESGAIPEEFVTEYCADRVETTATVWLGVTLTCCRCHDHKFDPFTQRDYYSLFAFFHNLPEVGLGNAAGAIGRTAPPFLKLPAPGLEAKEAALNVDLAKARRQLKRVKDSKDAEAVRLVDRVKVLKRQIYETEQQIPTALVMQEMPQPRPTFILVRGAYNKHGTEVTADTPTTLPHLPLGLPRNRLGLARWLVDPANPLTARVTVNRLWQSLFGVGLVRTVEDFGTQGELPSHPELLDWLATEFARRNWDVKSMLRLLVNSSTYRQSSRMTAISLERDPENRLLSRGPRYRLQAEFLRDQALAASGLLVSKIGGPSVRPYNPPGLYEQVVSSYVAPTYPLGSGSELYRRSLYTYWKRSVPNPTLLLFDAPFRETCTVRRTRTNTPLQALDLMNDPTYVEAARCLAERMAREGGATSSQRLTLGFELVLARIPRESELGILVAAYDRAHADFRNDPVAVTNLLKVGKSVADPTIKPPELAALTTVASTLLNLDEAVTKE
jgi:Protein of unknown function (DUF1553)/Protein of unknown function (DUF1549)/Planctomycete cytochrome C